MWFSRRLKIVKECLNDLDLSYRNFSGAKLVQVGFQRASLKGASSLTI